MAGRAYQATRRERAFLYLPEGWDAVWKAARALVGSAPANITVLGDSVSQGAFATPDWGTAGWAGLVRDALWTKYPASGEYFDVCHSVAGSPAYVGTPPWVINDTAHAVAAGAAGYCYVFRFTGAVTNPMQTFVSPFTCVDLEPIWMTPYNGVGQSWTYTVDGGSTQTVNLPAASSTLYYKTAINGLSNAVHTFRVTGQTADNAAYIFGINAFKDRTKGIGFANISVAGQIASLYISASGVQPLNRNRLFTGYTNAAQTDTGMGFPTQAHLNIIALGVNDLQTVELGRGPSRYALVLERLIQAMRRGRPNCSIMLVAVANPDPNTTDISPLTPLINAKWWGLYVAEMVKLARRHNCALVNFDAKWMGQTSALGFQTASVHPTNAGHLDMANTILGVI